VGGAPSSCDPPGYVPNDNAEKVAGKGGRDEDDGAWYERPFEAELEDDWG
jgi:hypothetical protein